MNVTHNSRSLGLLAVRRAASQPSHANAVAPVKSLELLKRDLRLATLRSLYDKLSAVCYCKTSPTSTHHELLSADKGGLLNLEWLSIATIPDDVDGRGVIDEVLG